MVDKTGLLITNCDYLQTISNVVSRKTKENDEPMFLHNENKSNKFYHTYSKPKS